MAFLIIRLISGILLDMKLTRLYPSVFRANFFQESDVIAQFPCESSVSVLLNDYMVAPFRPV